MILSVPLCTDILQDISHRGIRCRDVILFRLYYDAKECTFVVYARDAGDIGGDGATLLINLSRGWAKRKRVISTVCRCARCRISPSPSRENGAGAFAKCAFAMRILAHLRKSKHLRQFGRLGANPSRSPSCYKGGFNFLAVFPVCWSLPDWPIVRPSLRKCTHVISR